MNSAANSNGQKPPNYGSFESSAREKAAADEQQTKISINSSAKGSPIDPTLVVDQPERESLVLRLAKRIPCLGIMLALCASLFLGSAGMLVKMTRSVHGIQVAVLRKLPLWPDRSEVKPVMGRALLGATSITFSYYALRLIPLGDATTIRFSLPIWTLIIGYLVLGEPCNLLRLVAVVISISGVVLIAKPEECVHLVHMLWHSLGVESDETFEAERKAFELFNNSTSPLHMGVEQPPSHPEYRQFEGSLLALGSSICLSLSLVAMRLCRKTPAELVILWLSIIGIVIGSVTLLALDEWSMPDNWLDVLYILLNGLCGAVGQWFITNALKVEQSGIISLVRTFDIEVAFLYSAFLLHEHIRLTSIVGSCLVTVGVLAVLVPKWLWPSQQASAAQSNSQQQIMINGESHQHKDKDDHHRLQQQQQQQQQQQHGYHEKAAAIPTISLDQAKH